ncbi:uncharacterized protein [Malus domestica]|uniref:uncharacterized protein n=1 Tax=Malus domestica TaxID=3750 RepID=UPI00397622B8
MPTFVNPGGPSCLPMTFLLAVRTAERVGKCIIPTSSLGSLATSKVARSLFSPLGSRSLKKVEVVAAAAAEKKSVASKRAKTVVPVLPSKRPRQEAKPTIEAPRPAKRVKKLAKKGAREIHVISSQTTGAMTPSVSSSLTIGQALVEKQPTPTVKTVQARPVSGVGAPVVAPSVGATPVLEKAVPAIEKTSPAHPKPSIVVLEESEGSDEVPVASRPHPRRQPLPGSEVAVSVGPSTAYRGKRPAEEPVAATETPAPPQDQDVHSTSEAAVPIGPSTTDRGKRLAEEPEATAETPIHPQDQDLNILPQEATSAFASWDVEFKALLSSTTGRAGPSAATTDTADSTALTRLQELSGEAVVQASTVLERVRETFSIFESALRAKHDLQAAMAVQDSLHPKIDALKAKGDSLADLDRQMAKLAKRLSAIASDLAKDFESGGKACLTEYAANTKRVKQLKMDKKNR